VLDFQGRLGIETDREAVKAKRWKSAIGDVRDKAVETGAEGLGLIGRFGSDSILIARSLSDKVALKVAEGRSVDAGTANSANRDRLVPNSSRGRRAARGMCSTGSRRDCLLVR